ncbi:MAG: hypothetical protein QM770_00335 [Tepidisphaeraceae bacterium]
MLFSARVVDFKCDSCSAQHSLVLPTSIIPIAVVVYVASLFWRKALSHFVAYKWLQVTLGLALAFGSICLLFAFYESVILRELRRGICPKCGSKLTQISSGFWDGIIPTWAEVVIYASSIAAAAGVAAVVH